MQERSKRLREWLVKHWLAAAGFALFVVLVLWAPSQGRLTALAPFIWPATIVVCCMLFREPLTRLIDRIHEVSLQGLKCGVDRSDDRVVTDSSRERQVSPRDGQATTELLGFSLPARTLLATLAHYQRGVDTRLGERWWMKIPRGAANWPTFAGGAGELMKHGLIVSEPPDWKTYLTDAGIAFCDRHRDVLDAVPPITNFAPE